MNSLNAYPLPLLTNELACLLGLALAVIAIVRARRLLLLPLSVIVFLLTNGVFLALPLVFTVEVPFPTAPLLYARAAEAHSIFVAVAAIPLLMLAFLRTAAFNRRPPSVSALVPFVLFGIGGACAAFFIIRNPEIIKMSPTIYRTDSYEGYIDARNAVSELYLGKTFSGNGLLSLAFAFFLPAALALFPLANSISIGIRRMLQIIAWLLMATLALLIGSRMMLCFAVVYPLALWWYRRVSERSLLGQMGGSWKTILTWICCAALGIGVFQFAVHSTIPEAAFLLFSRIFVAPGAVSGGYYLLFPDVFPFRGAAGIFMMPVQSDVVNFSMISIAATGFDSHANGSFLATAYSAFGYFGVLIVSSALVAGSFLVDLLLLRLHRRLASLIVIGNIFGILTVSSVPFRIAAATHGYLFGPACVLFLIAVAQELVRVPIKTCCTESLGDRMHCG